jgi:2-polyprenyl-3-methyl-5-hydroxy-6-metoxy-1,4-benzoquinol methylase
VNRTAATTLARYAEEPLGTRLHTRVRWRSCPFEAVAEAVPTTGRILEIGCGHGLFSTYLALSEPGGRTVVGTDVDGDKIQAARRAAERIPNLRFAPAEPGELPEGTWDAICIVDVLYLIDRDGERGLLHAAAERLDPGGVLVVKEMATEPAWKFRWMAAQERLSVQVLRITTGHDLTFVPPDELAAWMEEAGLVDVAHRRLDRGHLHPHHLVTARKPPVPGSA